MNAYDFNKCKPNQCEKCKYNIHKGLGTNKCQLILNEIKSKKRRKQNDKSD